MFEQVEGPELSLVYTRRLPGGQTEIRDTSPSQSQTLPKALQTTMAPTPLPVGKQ